MNGPVPPVTVNVSVAAVRYVVESGEAAADMEGGPLTITLITMLAVADTESVTVIVS